MIAERGVAVTHTSIMRWVLRYVPEYEKRWARFARPVGRSWRMDETAVSIRGEPHYLYRAVDGHGKSVHSLLCSERTTESAQAFLRKAVARQGAAVAEHHQPGWVYGQSPRPATASAGRRSLARCSGS